MKGWSEQSHVFHIQFNGANYDCGFFLPERIDRQTLSSGNINTNDQYQPTHTHTHALASAHAHDYQFRREKSVHTSSCLVETTNNIRTITPNQKNG